MCVFVWYVCICVHVFVCACVHACVCLCLHVSVDVVEKLEEESNVLRDWEARVGFTEEMRTPRQVRWGTCLLTFTFCKKII